MKAEQVPPHLRHQHQALHATQRTIGNVLVLLGITVGLVLLTRLPAVHAAFGIGPWAMGAAMTLCWVGIVQATLIYHAAGVDSQAYVTADMVETALIQAGIMGLIFASGRDVSAFWILYGAHAMVVLSETARPRALLAIFTAPPLCLALSLVVWRHNTAAAAFAVIAAAVTGFALRTSLRTNTLLAESVAERERLSAELAELKLRDERLRIARDLHDGLGADLAAVAWRAERILTEHGPGPSQHELEGIIERAGQGIDELRSVVWALRSPSKRWAEIVAYLRSRCNELCAGRVGFTLEDSGAAEREIPGELSAHVVRMVQEVVRNAVRHGAPGRVKVVLAAGDGLHVVVTDDGTGIPVAAASLQSGGLENLRQRAAAAGGRVEIHAPAQGSRIEIFLPLPALVQVEAEVG